MDDDDVEEVEFTPLNVLAVHFKGDVDKASEIMNVLSDVAASLVDNLMSYSGIAFTDEEPLGMFVVFSQWDDFDEETIQ